MNIRRGFNGAGTRRIVTAFYLFWYFVIFVEISHGALGALQELVGDWVRIVLIAVPLVVAITGFCVVELSGKRQMARRYVLFIFLCVVSIVGIFVAERALIESVSWSGPSPSLAEWRERESQLGFRIAFRTKGNCRHVMFLRGSGRAERVYAVTGQASVSP